MWAIDSPPEWIERKRRGRDGERRTEKQLRELERNGWAVAHDIHSERVGNFDHLVVGPGGCYLLETKNFTGRAEVEHGRLTLHRGDDERDSWHPAWPIDRAVRGAAAEAQKRLKAGTGFPWFQGVIVLWSDFDQREAELDRVFVVHGDHLVDWLRSRPVVLQGEKLEQARRHLADLQVYEIERERLDAAA